MSDSLRMTIGYEEGEHGWLIASGAKVPGTISQGRLSPEPCGRE